MELCVQRRTALDLIGEGVPDWEDENIEQAPVVCPGEEEDSRNGQSLRWVHLKMARLE